MSNSELHVIFGTGPLGKWTARALAQMGKRVRVVNRSGQVSGLPANVEIAKGDAYDKANVIALTQDATVIYQCMNAPYHEWAEKFPPLQANVLAAAIANDAKLIVGDNLYMYGDTHGQPIREEMPYQAHTQKGQVRAQMAEQVMAAHQRGQARVAIGRASNFFGPDDPIYANLWFRPALAGKRVNLIGRLDQPHTFTYVPDFGQTLAILGTHDEALGQIWFAPSDAVVTQQQLLDIIAAEVGRPVKPLVGSPLMLRMMGLFNPTIREIVEMMYEWTQPFVMDSHKFTRAFGLQATPIHQAVRESVAWCKAQPLLNGRH